LMKSLIRWTATLGLVGTTMLTSLLGSYSKALALPEEQIVRTLQSVLSLLLPMIKEFP